MKRLLLILILTFSFQSWTKADDFRDFEIDGMSVGDSLLDHFVLDRIENGEITTYPNSDKFYTLSIKNENTSETETYYQYSFILKSNDKNYEIYTLAGDLIFKDDIEGCLKKKKLIVKEISSMFEKIKPNDYRHNYDMDDGKSYALITDFKFEEGFIRVYCIDWSEATMKTMYTEDMLSVDISSKESLEWLSNEAY